MFSSWMACIKFNTMHVSSAPGGCLEGRLVVGSKATRWTVGGVLLGLELLACSRDVAYL